MLANFHKRVQKGPGEKGPGEKGPGEKGPELFSNRVNGEKVKSIAFWGVIAFL